MIFLDKVCFKPATVVGYKNVSIPDTFFETRDAVLRAILSPSRLEEATKQNKAQQPRACLAQSFSG